MRQAAGKTTRSAVFTAEYTLGELVSQEELLFVRSGKHVPECEATVLDGS